jgi:hypothetical protein
MTPHKRRSCLARLLRALSSILIAALALLAAGALLIWQSRPPRTDHQEALFRGVSYTRSVRSEPRPLMIHVVSVDLRSPGIRFLVTPGDPRCGMELCAATTGDFLETFDLQVAVNGSYFTPWKDNLPWDYYPHSGDPVDATGLAISNGALYSADERRPRLCIRERAVQVTRGPCPPNTQQAVSGNVMLVEQGHLAPDLDPGNTELHPRSAVALSADGAQLWLIVVDGRQGGYSEGVSLAELAQVADQLGAHTAMNLDGGGSSTLVVAGAGGPRTLNAPIHGRIPMRQRPVANHLGIYAAPLER